MPVRTWQYRGHHIESHPKGIRYKYLVWLSPSKLLASTTLAELMAELDRL